MKEACGSVAQVSAVAELVLPSRPSFAILSGDDGLCVPLRLPRSTPRTHVCRHRTLPMMAVGAVGTVSVLSNILPRASVAMVAAASSGDFAAAKEAHFRFAPLVRACFADPNPVPAKQCVCAAFGRVLVLPAPAPHVSAVAG